MERQYGFSRYFILILVFLSLTLSAGGAAAQDTAVRDPKALAERFSGYRGEAIELPLTPLYRVGDTMEFWVSKNSSETPVRISATLAALTPDVYIWVEDGIETTTALQERARLFSQAIFFYRQRDLYREPTSLPSGDTLNDFTDLLPLPDVDNDPHLYILFATDLRESREATFNPIDSLPVELAQYSNQHEILTVDTSGLPGAALTDPIYASTIVRGIYRWIMNNNIPQQPNWLTEAFNWALLFAIQQQPVSQENLGAYLQAPDTSLIQQPTLTTLAQAIGEQQLFLAYLLQRYGDNVYTDLFMQTGEGVSALDTVLAQRNIIDSATGAPVTARDAFADFVLTNILNIPFGDARYAHSVLQLPQRASPTELSLPSGQLSGSVNQFGAQYFVYTAESAETISVSFDGSPTAARVPMPFATDPTNRFYWTGGDDDRNPTLTRTVDLSGVENATLTFDAWYALMPGWNYGYVSASRDGGATWDILSATNTSADNPFGAAYGEGFTGISSSAEVRPFPIMGVVISGGDLVTEVTAGSPADEAGILPNDLIVGYEGHEWLYEADVIGLLTEYAPGDTLNLLIERDGERLDIPVVLRAHPTRIAVPFPRWMPQTVDLTAYAGEEILLRFETVTLPGREDRGFAVDNLAIAEIGWSDDAEGNADGWTVNGWQQVDNQMRQQWLVQAITGGTETQAPRVQRLIDWNADVSNGQWRFTLGAGETFLLAVSGVNDDTAERAAYSLGVERE